MMGESMRVCGEMETLTDMVDIIQRIVYMREILKIANPMSKASALGQMGDTMMVNTTWAAKKAQANIDSRMVKFMKGNGKMENNQEKEELFIWMERVQKAIGWMENKCNDNKIFQFELKYRLIKYRCEIK